MNRNIGPAIVIVDKGLKIRMFSPSAQRILNLLPSVVGLPITSIKMRTNVEDLEDTISKVISKLHSITREVKDEEAHYFDLQVTPYITLEDKIAGAVLSFNNVDDRKELEKSQRLAAIGETAGMVGHDIRNPLQAIVSDTYLVKSDLDSLPETEEKKKALEGLEEIARNTDYINKIVADLQDYAKIIKPVFEEIDLEALCKEIVSGRNIPENIKRECYVEKYVKTIKGDSTLLKRILGNLVSNAVQAMPNGGALTVQAHPEEGNIVIIVQDTGTGIPDRFKPRLFTPLFTTKSKGQGLGLSVVKRMTEALGGTITFESKEGNGTTFIVRLPPPQRVTVNERSNNVQLSISFCKKDLQNGARSVRFLTLPFRSFFIYLLQNAIY